MSKLPPARRASRRKKWLIRISGAYVGGLALLFALWQSVGEDAWPLALSLHLPLLPFLPALVLALVIGVVYQRRTLSAASIGCIFVLLVPVMGLELGQTSPRTQTERHFKIYTHNLRGVPQLDSVVEQLERVTPDIVLFQEASQVDEKVWKHRAPDFQWVKRGQFVLGSKFDVTKTDVLWHRGCVRYELLVNNTVVTVFNIHPPSIGAALAHTLGAKVPNPPRRWQNMDGSAVLRDDIRRRLGALEGIAKDARAVDGPVVVAGDSNVPGGGVFFRRTFEGLDDAFQQAGTGWGYSFPARLPWMRIDRIWVSHGFHVQSAVVDGAAGSDHLAVIADVAL